MRLRIPAAAAVSFTTVAALALAGCASYQEIREDCAAKVAHMDGPPKHVRNDPRPDECEDVKQQDYDKIVLSRTFHDKGWVDDDGNVDINKVLDE